ncbi:MAG: type 2 lantipeptide synthetase LanM [Clostridiales bacterium]|nr:type 2 lantipeptide synthetase LanM [Clostridiales bacterium]
MWEKYIREKIFGCFYIHFCKKGINFFKRVLYQYNLEEDDINEEIIAKNCYRQLKGLPVRVLIYEMQQNVEKNNLKVLDEREGYDYYNDHFLTNDAYLQTLNIKYPELFRLLSLRMKQTVILLCDILSAIKDDQEELEALCNYNKFNGIEDIQLGLSDAHNGGKTVAKVVLDNKTALIYKPHSIKKEAQYQNIFNRMCMECGMEGFSFSCIIKENYGWEAFLKQEECRNKAEVERYYFRCGIHIFLAWILDATDLHGENIMSIGEYPVVLDAETIPGIFEMKRSQNVDEYVTNLIQNSVLKSGFLPVSVFEKLGGNCFNALHLPGKQKIKLKSPFVENEKTLKMKIGYKDVEIDLNGSIPVLAGISIGPIEYTEVICDGFRQAYIRYMENNTEFDKMILDLYDGEFRIVRRNTQQYAMLQSISLYPDYLQSYNSRKKFLEYLRRWDKSVSEINEQIQNYEIEALLNLDIPLFYGKGVTDKIYRGQEIEGITYFDNLPLDGFHLKKQCLKNEFSKQIWLIRTALRGLSKADVGTKSGEYKKRIAPEKDRMEIIIKKIADEICDTAIIDHNGEVSWIGIRVEENGHWKYNPIDMYFYEGVAGMAVFMAGIVQKYPSDLYKKIYHMILKRMFSYTQCILKDHDMLESKRTGALTGEGSIILSYIFQYKVSHDKNILQMAENHIWALEKIWMKDSNFDFLSGNAGFIYVLLQLYECTYDSKYLSWAREVGEWLWGKRSITPYGTGWLIGEEKLPLTGMAHGNSGFIFSYSQLLRFTHEEKYSSIIKDLVKYENNFYSENIGNWIDLRGNALDQSKDVQGRNSWCHGAPGILISRLCLRELKEFSCDMEIERDIARAIESLLHADYEDEICLCHGRSGNLMILKKYLENIPSNKNVDEKINYLFAEIVEMFEKEVGYKISERFQPGFMNGMTGVGMMLLVYNMT